MREIPVPFDPFAETLPMIDLRMDWRFLDLRRPENLLIFKVQTTAEHAMREYWLKHNFIEIHSPKIMGAPSESGAELFEMKYFERKAYLAQSPAVLQADGAWRPGSTACSRSARSSAPTPPSPRAT